MLGLCEGCKSYVRVVLGLCEGCKSCVRVVLGSCEGCVRVVRVVLDHLPIINFGGCSLLNIPPILCKTSSRGCYWMYVGPVSSPDLSRSLSR